TGQREVRRARPPRLGLIVGTTRGNPGTPELRQPLMKIDVHLRIGVGPGGVVNTKRSIELDLPLQTLGRMKIDFSAWHADSVRTRDIYLSGSGQRCTMGNSWRRENFGPTAHNTLPTAAFPASGSTRRRLEPFRRAGVSAAVPPSRNRAAGSEDSQPSDLAMRSRSEWAPPFKEECTAFWRRRS